MAKRTPKPVAEEALAIPPLPTVPGPFPAPAPDAGDRPVTGVVIEHGEAAEDGAAFESFRQAMVDHHRPQGPVEEDLVTRLVDLSWRQRRLVRVERGLVALRAREEEARRKTYSEAAEDPIDEDTEVFDVLSFGDPDEYRWAGARIAVLRTAVDEDTVEDFTELVDSLDQMLGREADGRRPPEIDAIARALTQVEPPARDAGHGKQASPLPAAAKAAVLDALQAILIRLRDLSAQAQDRALATHRIRVEAAGLPESEDLNALVRYEAHLGDCFTRTAQALRREQARRRLREALPRLGQA